MWSLVGLWVRWPLGIELLGEVASTSPVPLLFSIVQLSYTLGVSSVLVAPQGFALALNKSSACNIPNPDIFYF